jgi:phosphatidylglycerol lysyltransferase
MTVSESSLPLSLGHSLPVLALTGVVLVLVGVGRRSPAVARLVKAGGDVSSALVPRALAFTTFLAGVILLFSGATPVKASRLGWLANVLPLPVIEVSAYFESIAGIALILLARGLQRRLDAAYHLTLWVLGGGIVFALSSALDVEQAILLAITLAIFLPSQRFFYRRSSLFDERFTRGWYIAIGGVVIATAALTYQGFGHAVVTTRVFWEFGDSAEAPRAARALSLAIVTLLALSLARLLRPSRVRAASPSVDTDVVESIVRESPRANSHLALLGDKELVLDETGSALLMIGTKGLSRVVMGDPIGPIPQAAALIDTFVRSCEREGSWPVFYRVGPELLYLYLDQGLSVVKLGEVARVALDHFSLDGPQRRNLRRVWRKLVDAGCSFEVVPADAVRDYTARLRIISDEWLEQKHAREKGFSLGRFDDQFVARGPVALVRVRGSIVAFATLWQSGGRAEVEVDLMRHSVDAPPGVMRYLLTEAMLWARHERYADFNLGMVPLAGIRTWAEAPLWNQLATALRSSGERYYNFQGLREFKAWFYPEWEPNYLISPRGVKRPLIIANIAALISGGTRGVLRR